MTDETFTELVNLYFDDEISEKDLARLKAELAENKVRQEAFVERCRLNRAMQLALRPDVSTGGEKRRQPASVGLFSWFMGTGLAALLVLGVIFLVSPVINDSYRLGSATGGAGANSNSASPDSIEQMLNGWSSRAELKRFAARQNQGFENESASLAAQLRLMGLRPEMTPRDKNLQTIRLPASNGEPTRSQAELLSALQRHSVMPEPRILRYEPAAGSVAETGFDSTTGGFRSALTRFR